MIYHRLKEVKNGKEIEYKVDLVERHWFLEKKLCEILGGIKKEEEGQALVTALESGFKSGVRAAERKTGLEIKL